MLNERIKDLRQKCGLTQKELADKVCVTPQAVSRWENGEVEPSVGTLKEMAKIFNVSLDELLDNEFKQPEPEKEIVEKVVVQKEYVVEQQKPVLAVCQECNKPIYDAKDIVRNSVDKEVFCVKCYNERKERQHKYKVDFGKSQRTKSFVWGGIITGLILLITIIVNSSVKVPGWAWGVTIPVACLFFPFISCLFLKNNFVGDMVSGIASWGFVKLPGLIFTLDLHGIIWFLTVKLAFWIFGIFLAICSTLLAVVIGLIVCIFVYPFAIVKSIKHPELAED